MSSPRMLVLCSSADLCAARFRISSSTGGWWWPPSSASSAPRAVGAGGIFVPLLNLVLGFDTKSAAALSKCMIMGASASSVWYNLQVSHPTKEAPVLDYKLALLFQPMLMLGITIGVELSVVFPYWLITVLIIILFVGTSLRSFYKGILMWREETRILMETREREAQSKSSSATSDVVLDASYAEPLLPQSKPIEKSGLETLMFNLRWKHILVLLAVWSSFLVLQILKNSSKTCSTFYWVINILQVPAALIFCAFCGLLGGTVGGLLGSGGGFILGPLLLELGCIPQVASATATFVMMFSSSLSVVEFYFLGRFPIPYALYLIFISILAGFWGQCLVRKIVHVLKRASLIVFILSSVIFASALTMGIDHYSTSDLTNCSPVKLKISQTKHSLWCCRDREEHLDDQQARIHGVPQLLLSEQTKQATARPGENPGQYLIDLTSPQSTSVQG
ncbi:hypothetical protein TRIUR3_23950 [Triticum urartu]|uniref:Sulfite exporter TauE/SafE family protein 3 n=1 Tax=Triticum urartu TaxID=4572 RepID=M7ZX41_TRIUA|nr:hypothetical protein TRIUR3_23950 [Triticum urartu]